MERPFKILIFQYYFTSSKITTYDYQHFRNTWYKYGTNKSSIFLRHIGIFSVFNSTKILKKNRNAIILVLNDFI